MKTKARPHALKFALAASVALHLAPLAVPQSVLDRRDPYFSHTLSKAAWLRIHLSRPAPTTEPAIDVQVIGHPADESSGETRYTQEAIEPATSTLNTMGIHPPGAGDEMASWRKPRAENTPLDAAGMPPLWQQRFGDEARTVDEPVAMLTELVFSFPTGESRPMRVVVALIIDSNGALEDAELVAGDEPFARLVLDRLADAEFRPAFVNGKPLRHFTQVTVDFCPPERTFVCPY